MLGDRAELETSPVNARTKDIHRSRSELGNWGHKVSECVAFRMGLFQVMERRWREEVGRAGAVCELLLSLKSQDKGTRWLQTPWLNEQSARGAGRCCKVLGPWREAEVL